MGEDRGTNRTARNFGSLAGLAASLAVVVALAMVGVFVLTHRPIGPGPATAGRTESPSSPSPTPPFFPGTAVLSAPSPGVAWVWVDYGKLYLSTNQGGSWQLRSVPHYSGGWGQAQMSFVDGRTGWILYPGEPETQCNGAGAQLWRTTDGAASWQLAASVGHDQQTASGLGYAQCKEGVSFVDSMHGFVMADDPNRRPTIYRTTDGGSTWLSSTLPDPPDFTTQAGGFTLRAVQIKDFGSALLLVAWGSQDSAGHDRQYIFQSTNGGVTWSDLVKIPSPYVALVAKSRWLVLIVPGQSMETVNSGRQWHPYESDFTTGTPVGGAQIVFADSTVGYAEGRGALQRTIDGGLHWKRIATPGIAQPG